MKRVPNKKPDKKGPPKPRKKNPLKRIEQCSAWIAECPRHPNAFFERAFYKQELGDFEGALLDYNEGLRLRPDDEWGLNARGIVKSDMGDHIGAIEDYDKVIVLNPECKEAWHNRANSNFESGNVQEAIIDYSMVLNIDPEYMGALWVEQVQNRGLGIIREPLKIIMK